MLTDVDKASIREHVKSKVFDQFAIASETGLLLNHQYYELSEIIKSWIKKNHADSDKYSISNRLFVKEFNDCINKYIYDSLSPFCHSSISYKNGQRFSISKLIAERLFQVQSNNESITGVYSKDDPQAYLRLFCFYDEYKYSWDECWILDQFDNYKWYRGYFHKANIPGICGSENTIVGALEPEDSECYYVYASNLTEAQALIISRYFGDNRLVNGIIPIERIFKDYTYSVDWQSFIVKSVEVEGEEEDRNWSLMHLGFYLPGSQMIDPNSIWLKPSLDGSYYAVDDAYGWYKKTLSVEDELSSKDEFYLNEHNDFINAGLIPFERIENSNYSLYEYKNALILFRESYSELVSHEVLKPFSRDSLWLYAIDVEDARFKFQTFDICSIYNTKEAKAEIDEKYGDDFKSFLREKRDQFLSAEEKPIEESIIFDDKCFIGVPFEKYKIILDTIGKRKGCFPFIGIKSFERRNRFAFLQKDNLYILHFCDDFAKTAVCFGGNSKEAYGELTKNKEDPTYDPMDVNVYSPYSGKISGFSVKASFFAYYLLYAKEKEAQNG